MCVNSPLTAAASIRASTDASVNGVLPTVKKSLKTVDLGQRLDPGSPGASLRCSSRARSCPVGRCASLNHRARSPAHLRHEPVIALLPLEPLVRSHVAEAIRMDMLHAGPVADALEKLTEPTVG